MKHINNPFTRYEGYDCFGCCPDNPIGLKMSFTENGDYVYSTWEPSTHYQGYLNVLHGGIQATLMDEIASWTVYVKAKTAGVTSEIRSKFLKPVYINKGPVTLRAKILKRDGKIATVYVGLYDSGEMLCAESEVDYHIFPAAVARRKLYFPGADQFYK